MNKQQYIEYRLLIAENIQKHWYGHLKQPVFSVLSNSI